jgi:hypothetical protein
MNPGRCDLGYCKGGQAYDYSTNVCKYPEAHLNESTWTTTWPAKSSGSSDTLIGAIVGGTIGGFALIALIVWLCCCCARPNSGPMPMNTYAQQGNYQMPSNQQRPWFSSYADTRGSQGYYVEAQSAPTFFQKAPFGAEPVKRFQPNDFTYGGGF